MLELALFDRETLSRQFHCSHRLAARIGAWIGQRIALSLTVLESAVPGSLLEKLLLEKDLLMRDGLADRLAAALASPTYADVEAEFSLTVIGENEWTVIATAEDALASSGFAQLDAAAGGEGGNAPLAPAPAAAGEIAPPAPASGLTPARPLTPAAGSSPVSAGFSPEETARLRINIFTAPTSAEKVSALGQFAFAPAAAGEKFNVFLQALADEDAQLRGAAARGLRNFGIDAGIAETLAAFTAKNELTLNAERLLDLLRTAAAETVPARNAVLMLLAGCVRDKNFSGGELDTAPQTLAAAINGDNASLAASGDFLRLLQERMLAGGSTGNFREVFAAVERIQPGRVSAYLVEEIKQTHSDAYRALLFTVIGGWEISPEARTELLPNALQTFAALPVNHDKSYALRKFVFDCGDAGLQAAAEKMAAFSTAHQRAAVRFADNVLHSGNPAPAVVEIFARACLPLLLNGPLALRVDILETQVCLRADLPGELRAEIAAAVLRDWTDYAGWPLNTTFENALTRLGAPAVAPLIAQLRAQKSHPESAVFAAALGRIGIDLPPDDSAADKLAADILREVTTMTFRETAIGDALHLAMGQIAARPGLPANINSLVRRTLQERLGQNGNSAPLIEALGRACGGNLEQPEETRFVLTFAVQHLAREAGGTGLTVATRDGEEVFEIGAEVGEYSEVIPACLRALRHLASGSQVPAAIRRETIEKLLTFAEEPQKLSVSWGLANVSLLTETLGHIGAAAVTAERERLAIAVLLAKRVSSTAALEALAGIVAIPNRLPQFDRLAAALVERLLQKIIRDRNSDERETALRIMTRALMRGRFAVRGGTAETLLASAAEVYISCLKQGVAGTWQLLNSLQTAGIFSGATAELVAGELAQFTTLTAANG